MHKSENKWQSELREFKTKNECICKELVGLKEKFLNFKRDILSEVNVKIDSLIKTVSTMNSQSNYQPQPNASQKVQQKKKILLIGEECYRHGITKS